MDCLLKFLISVLIQICVDWGGPGQCVEQKAHTILKTSAPLRVPQLYVAKSVQAVRSIKTASAKVNVLHKASPRREFHCCDDCLEKKPIRDPLKATIRCLTRFRPIRPKSLLLIR